MPMEAIIISDLFSDNNMVDSQTCMMGAALAPLSMRLRNDI